MGFVFAMEENRLPNGKFRKGHKLNNGIKRKVTKRMKNAMMNNLEKALLSRKVNPIKYNGRKCVGVRPDKTFVVFQSCRYAQKVLEKPNGTIANKCQGRRKNRYAYGFFWFWEDENEWLDFIDNATDDYINEQINEYKRKSRERNKRNSSVLC